MCGIFAALTQENNYELKKYCDLIKHRGPDDSEFKKYYVSNRMNLYFGFHRLAIIDPNSRSNQPLILNNLVLVCNGEIFNYKNLIDKYKFSIKTGSDCEVILHLYEYFGRGEFALKKLLNELEAEFSFLLYDGKNKTLMAARDPFGIRPLFYGIKHNNYYFASELKALGFLNEAFAFPSASYQICSEWFNTLPKKYYEISFEKIYPEPNIDTIHHNIRSILDKAVQLRLMSDRPVGVLNSGGLDSSLILSLVSKYIPNIECFTIGLNDQGVDIIAAKKVVNFLNNNGRNIKHNIIHFTAEEGFKALRDVIWHLETYDITTCRAGVVKYFIAKFIKENTDIVVLYTGSGSDECFGGYVYSKLAPSPQELELDTKRLLEELLYFDNLRDDRCSSAFSLEIRVPFLDPRLINYIFALDPKYRTSSKEIIEKKLLRDAFKNENILPEEILYRPKDAWSDAVSSKEESWYKSLQKLIEPLISDEDLLDAKNKYPINSPLTKESLYYREIFNELFPNRNNIIPHFWLPKWCDTNGDPSARVLDLHHLE